MSLRRIFAAMVLVLVVAPLLANAPLFDPDEGLHAAIAQEMVTRGDYVTPTFLGEPFLDKPILFFWAEAASIRLFGSRELAVRLPPLVFGVLGMIGVAALGRALFDEPTGLLAGIAYGTMLLPLGVAEIAVHDVAVVPFMCAACVGLVRGVRPRGAASGLSRQIVLAGVALGLSILTKGLVAIAFAGLLAICLAVADRKAILRLTLFLTGAVTLAVLVALPWYLAMERAHPGYLYYYFVERHLQGYLTATQRHAGRGWWYYLPVIAGGTLPWTGYLAGAARIARASRARILVWAWFALGLVFLSAAESKLATYALPLFPALAILVADAILAAGFAARPGYAVFGATLALLPVLGVAAIAWKYGSADPKVWLLGAIVSTATTAVAVWIRRRATGPAAATAPLVLRVFVMAFFGLMIVAPRAAAWMSARDLAGWLNGTGRLPSHVSVLDERIGSLIFYLAPALRRDATAARVDTVSLPEAASRIRVEPDDAVVAVRDHLLPRFDRLFAVAPRPDASVGTFSVFRVATLRRALASQP